MTVTEQPSVRVSAGRDESIARLRAEQFDLLVIGGGINGAGVARDAAMRGLRVALVEKGDFASGTSGKSSKLIHGGIRYLQQGDLRLVRIACRERDLLRRCLAPHLVRPLEFLFPVYRGDPVGFFTLGAGMWLYDLLAVFRNIRTHRMLAPKRTLSLEPRLLSRGLRGAALYYDCFTDDARLTLETVLAARDEGAVAVNYLELSDFVKEDGRIVGARLEDRFGTINVEVRARCVVNVTGPWADRVRRLDDPSVRPCLRLTKGVHIVVPRDRVGNERAVVMHSPRDERVLFAIPWGSHAIIGTTDTDFTGSPDEVRADQADFEYLLESVNWYFPTAKLTQTDIVSSYAGLRPLVASSDEKNPSAVSREEEIFESSAGLITLAGGKLTTYRFVAEKIVDRVAKKLGKRKAASPTAEKPLPGGRAGDTQAFVQELVSRNGYGLSLDQVKHLVERYGSRTAEVMDLLSRREELKQQIVPDLPDIWAEVVYAIQMDMALRTDDVLLRRTHVGLKDPDGATKITDKMKEKLPVLRNGSDPK